MVGLAAMSVSLSVMTLVRQSHACLMKCTRRNTSLLLGIWVTLIAAIMNSILILNPKVRTIAWMIGSMNLTYIANYLFLHATCVRYYSQFSEQRKLYAEIASNLFALVVYMYLMAASATDVIFATNLYLVPFRFTRVLFLIPVFHLIFGILFLIKSMQQHLGAHTLRNKQLTFQAILTGTFVFFWILWIFTYATGRTSSASNIFLTSLSYALEQHVAMIAHIIKDEETTRLWSNLHQKRKEIIRRLSTIKKDRS
jgi:hypothetical protein